MLNLTIVKLKLTSNIEKYQLIENIKRVGILMIFKIYNKANKFLKSYDPSKPSTCIINLVVDTLCGHFTIQFLLIKVLDGVIPKKIMNNLAIYSDDCEIGYLFHFDVNILINSMIYVIIAL